MEETIHGASTNTTNAMSSINDFSPTPFRLGPERMILGVPVTTLSYIFLGVGGIAPLVFIIAVIAGMKCYSWRKRRSFKRQSGAGGVGSGRLHLSHDVWQLERRAHFNKNKACSVGVIVRGGGVNDGSTLGSRNELYAGGARSDMSDELAEFYYNPSDCHAVAHKIGLSYKNGQQSPHIHAARVSNSNPNVYFLETPVLQLHRNNKAKTTEKRHSRRLLGKKKNRFKSSLANKKVPVIAVESPTEDVNGSDIYNKQYETLERYAGQGVAKHEAKAAVEEIKLSPVHVTVNKESLNNGASSAHHPNIRASSLVVTSLCCNNNASTNNCNKVSVNKTDSSMKSDIIPDGIVINKSVPSQHPGGPCYPPSHPAPGVPSVLPTSMTSITSDEAEALHCFDDIYLEPVALGQVEITIEDEPRAADQYVQASESRIKPYLSDTGSYATSTDCEIHADKTDLIKRDTFSRSNRRKRKNDLTDRKGGKDRNGRFFGQPLANGWSPLMSHNRCKGDFLEPGEVLVDSVNPVFSDSEQVPRQPCSNPTQNGRRYAKRKSSSTTSTLLTAPSSLPMPPSSVSSCSSGLYTHIGEDVIGERFMHTNHRQGSQETLVEDSPLHLMTYTNAAFSVECEQYII